MFRPLWASAKKKNCANQSNLVFSLIFCVCAEEDGGCISRVNKDLKTTINSVLYPQLLSIVCFVAYLRLVRLPERMYRAEKTNIFHNKRLYFNFFFLFLHFICSVHVHVSIMNVIYYHLIFRVITSC